MDNLHDLTGLAADMWHMVELVASENDGEVPQEMLDMLDAANASVTDKLEACAALIEEWTALSNARKAEAKRLADLAAKDASRADRLKSWVRHCMESTGLSKATAGRFQVSIVGNGGQAPLVLSDGLDPQTLEPRFQTVKITANNAAIRQALESGEVLEWAKIGERGTTLRIK